MKRVEMDIRGQVCPSSLLLALQVANKNYMDIASGEMEVVIKTDNRDATGTIPNAVENMGVMAEIEKVEGYYKITLMSPKQ
jgi:TusA-related sulfurtransferase